MEGVRGEFNFVFDIEIVFVVRRRTGGGGLGSCEELAVAMVAIQWPGSRARAWHCPAAIAITLPVFARSQSGVSVREDTPETPETVRTQISSVPWSHTPHTDMEQTNRHFMSKYPH